MKIKRNLMQPPPQPKAPEKPAGEQYGSITSNRIAKWQQFQELRNTQLKKEPEKSVLEQLAEFAEELHAETLVKSRPDLNVSEELEELKEGEELEELDEFEEVMPGVIRKKPKKKQQNSKKRRYSAYTGFWVDEIC
jgi:hypothetical protein